MSMEAHRISEAIRRAARKLGQIVGGGAAAHRGGYGAVEYQLVLADEPVRIEPVISRRD
ncbi:MAG: hypothetical protein ACRDFS_11995 [Chloroflexota bacterium]